MKKLILLTMLFTGTMMYGQVNFIPQPQQVEFGKGDLLIEKGIVIYAPESEKFNVNYLTQRMERVFDFKVGTVKDYPSGQAISFEKDATVEPEGYRMEVDNKGVKIVSSSRAGEFYAIQTLLQMMPPAVYKETDDPGSMLLKEWHLPFVNITDRPRFEYRGSMLDVARTFFSKEYVMRHIEWLACHKINKFHFHLTDDNGWRVEIKKYPLLTQKGAWRGENEVLVPSFGSGNERYGGFYTQEEIREIVAFAKERNIEVIPEIELPGHSKAIAASYPDILCKSDNAVKSVQLEEGNVLCVGREENYKMLDNIIKELSKLFESEYIHIGGDEVEVDNWKECPLCQEVMKREGMHEESELLGYFVNRMQEILKKYGKKLAGWDEIATDSKLDKDSRVYAWRNASYGVSAVKNGHPVIMQIGKYCYFDMKYTPIERGHNWAGIVSMETAYSFDPYMFEIKGENYSFTDQEKKNIIGVQGALWSEMIIYPPHFSEYQMFPRLCVTSEIGWTDQDKRDYVDFDRRLTESHFARMYYMGIKFRIPYPEIKWEGNIVTATPPFPSATVRYTFDGTEPTVSSPVVCGPIITEAPENLRFATFFCDVNSMTVAVPGSVRYLEPAVKVTASARLGEHPRAVLKNLEDYDRNTYFRSAEKVEKGDYILFEFDNAVECKIIDVESSIPVIDFYGVADGHVEYSYDGISFIKGDKFRYYSASISGFTAPVKAVKIVFDGVGESKPISIRDLKIR